MTGPGGVSRRSFLRTAALVGAAAILPATVIEPPADTLAAAPTYDPLQRFVRLVPGGNGIIYGIQADGRLLWYRHVDWTTGGGTWANGGTGRVIGSGWQEFRAVLASSDGQLFGFPADGTVQWYRYVLSDLTTGSGTWAGGGGGPTIGTGFDRFPRVLGGWGGVIYGIDDSGAMWWYQYVAGDGSAGAGAWANGGTGAQIGTGWSVYKRTWADPDGVIFGVKQSGSLHWWRYLGTDGSVSWANSGVDVQIGSGWGEDSQKQAFSNGDGTVYAVALDTDPVNGLDDRLLWYRLANSGNITSGSVSWANGGTGVQVGSGFTVEPSAALQGYAADLGVQPGGTLAIAFSTTFPSYTASVVRLAPAGGAPVTVWGPETVSGRLQLLPSGYRQNGCGWGADVQLTIPSGWQSGIYAMRAEGPSSLHHYVVFVVRPSTPSAPVAFLLPTNTYNAYNCWAGHDRYAAQDGSELTFTFLRPSVTTDVDPPAAISHTLYSDLFLLRWMSANGVAFDCYHDGDLNGTASWLSGYRALVLASHPEYWTDSMRANLVTYLAAGGRLVCTGGNALYERTQLTPDGSASIWGPIGSRDLFQDHDQWESQIVGANLDGAAYLTFAGYQVDDASHPFLAGTGLADGDRFGATGHNGAASGWEVNGPIDPAHLTGQAVQIAHGGGQPNGGAAMVAISTSASGWVFSANSINFNGAIPYDQAIATLLRNVFAQAIA